MATAERRKSWISPARMVQSTGKPARLVGVVLPLGGQTWFYKLMGDESVVAQQKDAFIRVHPVGKYPNAH
jgi:hypothetical protein